MTARPPPELAGELYCRANLDPMIYTGMSPQIATELLDRAWHMLSQGQISFSYNYIDKPKEGSGFFLKVQPDEVTMPHDGFQYMDDEISYPFPQDPRVTITERSQGFAHGEQYTHIVRRKYTLVMPGRETLAFLHYSKADVGRSIVVDGRRAKTPPRQYPLKPIPGVAAMPGQQQPPVGYPPHQPPQQQQPPVPQQQAYRAQQQPPKMNTPYGASPIMGSPASPQQPPSQQQGYGRFPGGPIVGPPGGPPQQGMPPQRLSSVNSNVYGNQRHDKKSGGHKKHPQQQPQQPQLTPQQQREVQIQREAQMQEDTEEPSGDELDFLTARDVAIARYKRNHDYVAEVFSPYPTSRIIPPNSEYQKSIDFLKSLGGTQQQDDELDQIKAEHDEKIKRFKAEASVFYKGLEDLKQATTVQEVFAANERVEIYKGMTVQPYLGLRQVDLPKDEATRTPELKPAKVAKQVVPTAPVFHTPVTQLALAGTPVTSSTSMGVEAGGVVPNVPAPDVPAIATPVTTAPVDVTSATEIQEHNEPAIAPVAVVVATPVTEPLIEKAVEAALDNWSAPVAAAGELTSTQPAAPSTLSLSAPVATTGAEISSSSMEIDSLPSDNVAEIATSASTIQENTADIPAPILTEAVAELPLQETTVAPITPIHAPAEEPAAPAAVVIAPLPSVEPSTPVSLPESTASSNMDVDSNVASTEVTPVITSEPSLTTQDAEMTPAAPVVAADDVPSASPAVVEPVLEQQQQSQQQQHQQDQQGQPVETISAVESSLDQTHPPSS